MKLRIFGATGGTGAELVKQALERGHLVTIFVRNPAQLADKSNGLPVMTGDIHDFAGVERSTQGQDAVICALGARDLKKTIIRGEGTVVTTNAMKKKNVRRLIIVSATGVGESWNSLSRVNKLLFAIMMKSTRKDHEAQEAAIKESELDQTIIRPSRLVNSHRTGVYNVGENIPAKMSEIPQADVADLILNVLEERTLVQQAAIITN